MVTYEHFLALALLMAPPGTKEITFEPEVQGRVRAALQTLAVKMELLDPRETRYTLIRREDFHDDVEMLRKRYQELADAPPLHDAQRFPDRNVITELLAFNRSYREYLDAAQPMQMSRWWEVRTTLRENDHLYLVWDTIRDASCDYYHVTVRRRSLKKLRELLGADAYYRGELPPYVPLWRFQLVD